MAINFKNILPGAGGVPEDMPPEPALQAQLLTRPEGMQRIGKEEIQKAAEILQRYKSAKANLEDRVVQDEKWFQLRHWEVIRKKYGPVDAPEPASGWLFNAISNKHADAMDNYPEPNVLPREQSDEPSAKILSSVLPVILENNGFEQAYRAAWWEKLKHGAAIYGVFWDTQLENGMGDISIRLIDILDIFWEPGITDIQDSRNLFITSLVDTDLLDEEYPDYKGKFGGSVVDVAKYQYDDDVDTSDKTQVVDWYYKVKSPSGRKVLHYAKFAGDVLLYATENDPQTAETGLYDDGMYPVIIDGLWPEKGTPVAFGYVAICKDPQLYIDKLSSNIMENAMMATKKRFFKSTSTNVNEEQFLDWNRPLVDCEGEIDDRRLQEIKVTPLDGIYFNVLQSKIEEMKDTASNRDVNSGGSAGSGVTAAAAIAALQEAGNKTSRDMISASYATYSLLCKMVIERIRQFYDFGRAFRITGDKPGTYEYIRFSNEGIVDQSTGVGADGEELFRRPVFDLKITAQKKNPFSRASQNEFAKELYGLGFFNPERAQEAMMALDMMEFEGADKVREKVMEGQTLFNMVQQLSQRLDQAMGIMSAAGLIPPADMMQAVGDGAAPTAAPSGGGMNARMAAAQAPKESYGERLARRSTPNIEGT